MMSSSHKNKSSSGSPSMIIRRSISPSGKFYTSTMTSSPSRSTSPNRITINRPSPTPPSVRFTVTSPHRSSMTSSSPSSSKPSWSHGSKKTCLCSPTTHPGSFRCSLHKNNNTSSSTNGTNNGVYRSHRLHARRSAMTNSLVRIGTVEGDLVKRALAALIRPSSHQQRRRSDFKPRPTRLSNMTKAGE